ncbi:Cytochrome C oxidase subunit I [Azospirillaceae bacterium]
MTHETQVDQSPDPDGKGLRLWSYDALSPTLRGELYGWTMLALGSLAIAGALALLLVLARLPPTQNLLPWSWQSFFYTGLVAHVILSFVVWFLAILGILAVLVVSGKEPARWNGLGMPGVFAAILGSALLLTPTFLNDGEPSLNNYVPILVHPLYYIGLGLVGLGVALPTIRLLGNPKRLKGAIEFGVAMTGACYLIALICIGLAWSRLPSGLDIQTLNERVFWGGGHILQFVNTGLMLVAWVVLAKQGLGETPVSLTVFRVCMASMVAFSLSGVAFYALYDALSLESRLAFTDLLWYGLPLPPLVVGLGAVALLARRRADIARSPEALGLALSMLVFLAGGLMGFFLGPSDARTPAHYHSSIGGVNLAFMALIVTVALPALGRATINRRSVAMQFHGYGWGQLVFSVGMFVAGAAGVPRKTMGAAAQGLDSVLKKVAMGVYGLGGALAVIGGVLFVIYALRRLFARKDAVHD